MFRLWIFAFVMFCLGFMLWGAPGCTPATVGPGDGSSQGDGGDTSDRIAADNGAVTDVSSESPAPERVATESALEPTPEPVAEPTHEASNESPVDSGPQDAAPESVGEQPAAGMIQIYLNGDLSQQTFQDTYTGQTPTDYQIALSRYEVLTSLNDPAPQRCFDHGANPKVADMSKDNLMGACLTSAIKTGNYTHGRVKVDWAQYTVNGTLHANAQVLPGKFTFFRAYSDTTYMGKTYKPGEGWVRYTGFTTVEFPYQYPTPPAFPGMDFQLVSGEFFMTFPYKRVLPVDQANPQGHWARFHWKIFEAFRWEEKTLANYQKGTWDVDANPTLAEEVKVFGVSDYFITTSID